MGQINQKKQNTSNDMPSVLHNSAVIPLPVKSWQRSRLTQIFSMCATAGYFKRTDLQSNRTVPVLNDCTGLLLF